MGWGGCASRRGGSAAGGLGGTRRGVASAVDIETSPTRAARVQVSGVLAHTNHFFDPDGIGIWQPLDERSSTFTRCDRMQGLLERHRGGLDDARLMDLLRD